MLNIMVFIISADEYCYNFGSTELICINQRLNINRSTQPDIVLMQKENRITSDWRFLSYNLLQTDTETLYFTKLYTKLFYKVYLCDIYIDYR